MQDRWQELKPTANGNGRPSDEVTLQAADEHGEEEHPSRAFACLRGLKDKSETLELRFLAADTADVTLEYSLRRRMVWDKRSGTLTVEFVDGVKVVIAGTGLAEMKERLQLRKVTWVQEQGADAVAEKAAEQAARAAGQPHVWVRAVELVDADKAADAE